MIGKIHIAGAGAIVALSLLHACGGGLPPSQEPQEPEWRFSQPFAPNARELSYRKHCIEGVVYLDFGGGSVMPQIAENGSPVACGERK